MGDLRKRLERRILDGELLDKLEDRQLQAACKAVAGLLDDDRIVYFEIRHDKPDNEFRWLVLLDAGAQHFRGTSSSTLMLAVNIAVEKMRQHLERRSEGE